MNESVWTIGEKIIRGGGGVRTVRKPVPVKLYIKQNYHGLA
jgi:hypothetical protein